MIKKLTVLHLLIFLCNAASFSSGREDISQTDDIEIYLLVSFLLVVSMTFLLLLCSKKVNMSKNFRI